MSVACNDTVVDGQNDAPRLFQAPAYRPADFAATRLTRRTPKDTRACIASPVPTAGIVPRPRTGTNQKCHSNLLEDRCTVKFAKMCGNFASNAGFQKKTIRTGRHQAMADGSGHYPGNRNYSHLPGGAD
jgi:hypothetical protein